MVTDRNGRRDGTLHINKRNKMRYAAIPGVDSSRKTGFGHIRRNGRFLSISRMMPVARFREFWYCMVFTGSASPRQSRRAWFAEAQLYRPQSVPVPLLDGPVRHSERKNTILFSAKAAFQQGLVAFLAIQNLLNTAPPGLLQRLLGLSMEEFEEWLQQARSEGSVTG